MKKIVFLFSILSLSISSNGIIDTNNTFSNKRVLKISKSSYLRVNFTSTTASGNINIDVTHTHSYDYSYKWVDYYQHTSSCSCGASLLSNHAVSSSATAIGGYKTCLLCKGKAALGFIQFDINSSEVIYVTDNGSYILPNGVIVLEDEDIEAYLNGTLKFHNKDEVTI